MRFKLIGCEVFIREISHWIARSPHAIDAEYTEKQSHNDSCLLREEIRERIRQIEEGKTRYGAILLAFGLCGNSTAGIAAEKTKLVIPRAHDCCTIFLGSAGRFRDLFSDNPSRPFTSAGYMERGENDYLRESEGGKFLGLDKSYAEYVELYGEENARYIIETLTPPQKPDDSVFFIDTPETSHLGFAEKCREDAEKENREFRLIPGDSGLIRDLCAGNWSEDRFLILEPGEKIVPLYDWEKVMEKE
ncbi:MAG: DUF1638 domain-containing protein [Spirochaetia bacterium]